MMKKQFLLLIGLLGVVSVCVGGQTTISCVTVGGANIERCGVGCSTVDNYSNYQLGGNDGVREILFSCEPSENNSNCPSYWGWDKLPNGCDTGGGGGAGGGGGWIERLYSHLSIRYKFATVRASLFRHIKHSYPLPRYFAGVFSEIHLKT